MVIKFVFRQHIHFLKTVILYTFSAFGGPQGHFTLLHRFFVEREKLITATEFIDINLFCQILPGPTSTQIITLLAYKKGGITLSVLTLLLWILPATFLMLFLSLVFTTLKGEESMFLKLFNYLDTMALSFFLYYCIHIFSSVEKRKTTYGIIGITGLITYFFFHSPWIFPLVILFGGGVSYCFNVKSPKVKNTHKIKLYWGHLSIFLGIFLIAGLVSETARMQNWQHRKIFNVFENNYRFGTLVFGGGQILIPMIYEKYSVTQKTKYVEKKDILTGAGILQIVPGPVFSISTYVGSLIFEKEGVLWQIIGGLTASIAIFLPGYFLCIFFYPIWERVKYNNIIFRAMMGLKAAIAGLLFGSFICLILDNKNYICPNYTTYIHIFVFSYTFLFLKYTKITPPFIVLLTMLIGFVTF